MIHRIHARVPRAKPPSCRPAHLLAITKVTLNTWQLQRNTGHHEDGFFRTGFFRTGRLFPVGSVPGEKRYVEQMDFYQAISCRECVLIKLRRACSAATFTSRLIVHTQSKISFLHPLQTHSEVWLQIFSHPDCHHSMKFHTENRKPLQV